MFSVSTTTRNPRSAPATREPRADGAGMRRILAAERVDLVLLALGLPGEDGLP
jgi:hypothetical protein